MKDEETMLIEEIKEAVENIQLVHLGKLKVRRAIELLGEL